MDYKDLIDLITAEVGNVDALSAEIDRLELEIIQSIENIN